LRFKHCPNVDWKKFELESVLLDLSSGYYFRLNEVGTYIWPLLDGKHDLAEIVEEVVKRFEVSQRQAKKDISSFIQYLLTENLINKG
jgi:DNA-binding ferritin-like protein (Dps family)